MCARVCTGLRIYFHHWVRLIAWLVFELRQKTWMAHRRICRIFIHLRILHHLQRVECSSLWNKLNPDRSRSTVHQSKTRRGFGVWDFPARSDPEFVGLCQHHLENGHERRRLAEVAAADYVGVDVETLRVGSGLDTPGDVMKSSYDGGRELGSRTA